MLTKAALGLPLEVKVIRSRPKVTRLIMVEMLRLISAIPTVSIFLSLETIMVIMGIIPSFLILVDPHLSTSIVVNSRASPMIAPDASRSGRRDPLGAR